MRRGGLCSTLVVAGGGFDSAIAVAMLSSVTLGRLASGEAGREGASCSVDAVLDGGGGGVVSRAIPEWGYKNESRETYFGRKG